MVLHTIKLICCLLRSKLTKATGLSEAPSNGRISAHIYTGNAFSAATHTYEQSSMGVLIGRSFRGNDRLLDGFPVGRTLTFISKTATSNADHFEFKY